MKEYLNLIAKKLSNEANVEELRELQEWLDESKENELLFRRLDESWNRGMFKLVVQGHEKTFNNISTQLGLSDRSSMSSSKIRRIQLYWRRMAAIFILVIGIVGIWWYLNSVQRDGEGVTQSKLIVKSNPKGQKSLITLPDGSKVKLNSESYIEYPENFSQTRRVKLVGEAFFEVVHDNLHPFVVNCGDVYVRVLGTSFDVQAFPFNESMSVAVLTGKVLVENKKLQGDERTNVLLPKEMVQIDHKTGIFEKRSFNPDATLAWKDGILAFHKASFNEIVERLERWYGVEFVINRSTPITDGFTGRYENPTLKVVLEGMSFSSEFKFTIKGDTVFIN